MASRNDNDPTLPPLIDFSDDDANTGGGSVASPVSSSGVLKNDHFQDPFNDLHLPPVTPPSSSSINPEQWDVLHSATETQQNLFFDDQWVVQNQMPLPSSETGFFPATTASNSVDGLNSKVYDSGFNQYSFEVDDLLSDVSTSSVSCSRPDILSSAAKVSPPTPQSRLFPDVSTMSPQTPVRDSVSLWAIDSTTFQTPTTAKRTSLNGDIDSHYSSAGSSRPSFVDTPPNTSHPGFNSMMDEFSNISIHGNVLEDFCSGASFSNEKATNISDDMSFMMDCSCTDGKVITGQYGTASCNADSNSEFVAPGGVKGIFRTPDRRPDIPVPFELRPEPLNEDSVQTVRVLASMDTTLWSACDRGILVWDIPSAWKSNCQGKGNLAGDEDAAAYNLLATDDGPITCLFPDTANSIMWSGHKDGKVTAWELSSDSDGKCNVKSSPMFSWEAHQTPTLAIVVTSYGELWTGSEYGALRAWSSVALLDTLKSQKESKHSSTNSTDIPYIDLRSKAGASGAAGLLNVDVRFLVPDHSRGHVWSGGVNALALWDARTRDVLRVFGSNADSDFTSPNISPVREIASKAMKKEKAIGSLSFFQRSRNVVLGAADAVLRAAVGVQSVDESKKAEAIISTVDGYVWVGYANGRLVQYDSFANQLAEYRHTSAAIKCMCTSGNKMFVGYADGTIHSLAVDSGKLLRNWYAHKFSVVKLAVCGSHLFSIADNGAIRGWFIYCTEAFDASLHSRMISKEPTYVREESIRILAVTWNVAQERPRESYKHWLTEGCQDVDVVVIGLQEIEMGAGALAMAAAKETVGLGGSYNGQSWLDATEEVLKSKGFVRVGSRQLAGLLIDAWVSQEVRPYVGAVDVAAVACGFGRAFGNKGGVGIKMMIFRRAVCVVNGHFAAHPEAVAKRNADFEHIYNRMTFRRSYGGVTVAATAMAASAVQIIRGTSTRHDIMVTEVQDGVGDKGDDLEEQPRMPELSESDLLIWIGDFNYRLADLTYDDVLNLIYDKNWEYLLTKDQLRTEMRAGRVFQGMREAAISFPPTYKFDKGDDSAVAVYDTSEKKRIPAWCDRVLYRDSFINSGSHRQISISRPVAAKASRYQSIESVTGSDHKAVACYFDVQIAVINEAARRWEYGRFLRADAEAVRLQKEIEIIPQTHVNITDLQLVDKTVSILNITNDSVENHAVFRFFGEGKPILDVLRSKRHGALTWGNAVPFWLQIVPASGIIKPGETLEVKIQHSGADIFENASSSQQEFITSIKQAAETTLVLEVKGIQLMHSKQYQIRVSHIFSQAFCRQYNNYSHRQFG